MYTYLQVLLGLLLIGSVIETLGEKNKKRKLIPLYLFFVILMWFAAGFRYGDNDYLNYVDAYKYGSDYMEPGYQLINRVINYFGASPATFMSIFAALTLGVSAIFIYKYNPRFVITGLLVYFCHVFLLRDMMQIRAAIAIAGAMFSIPLIERRDFWRTLIIVLLMASMHFVAGFWLLVYVAYPILASRKKLIVVTLIVSIVVGAVMDLTFFGQLAERFNVRLLSNYVVDTDNNYTLGLTNPVLLKHLAIISVLLLKYNFFKKNIKYFEVMLVAYVIAAVFLSAFNSFAILAGRVGTLFSNVEHVLIPSLMLLPKRGKAVFWLAIAAYCVIVFYSKKELLQGLDFVTEHPYFLNHG